MPSPRYLFYTAVLGGLALASLACSAKERCEHYMQKNFNPMPDKAVEACTKVCEEDELLAACEHASRWSLARGEIDRARATGKKACELQGSTSCAELTIIESTLERDAFNEDEVAPLRARLRGCLDNPGPCEEGCARDEINACVQLADMYALGLGVTADPDRAAEFYAKACELHDDRNYCWSTMAFRVNPESCAVPDNRPPCDEELDGPCPGPPKPLPGCAEISRHDDLSAEQHLRICNGQRACDEMLERECLLEVEACQAACDADDDAARCRQISLMYEQGLGLARNPAKAASYRARACELGDTHSCEELVRDTRKLSPRPLPELPDGELPD